MTASLLTPEQVAEELQIPVKTLAQWRWLRQGPQWIKVGKHVRYRRAALDQWIGAQTRG